METLSHKTRNEKELRDFGLIAGGLLSPLFGLIFPWLRGYKYPLWPWALGVALVASALLRPQLLKYAFAIWNRLGVVLGWVNSRIVLTVIFYMVIVPMGLLMRFFGQDPMARNFNPEAATYRISSSKSSVESMDKPF